MKLFSQADVIKMMEMSEYISAVEYAHCLHGEGKVFEPSLLHADANDGEFHIKTGGIKGDRAYFGLKANGGFFQNSRRYGLPNIMGVIYLCDAEKGTPLALLDSVIITKYRTGAATAVAAKYLSRPDSEVVTVCGNGTQGRVQLEALCQVLPIKKVYAFDADRKVSEKYLDYCTEVLGLEAEFSDSLPHSIHDSDILVTCTPSRRPFIERSWIHDGMFIAAVGADSPGKQEFAPEVIADNKIVADIHYQCVRVGETQHAIKSSMISEDDVYGEIGKIITGEIPGRVSENETIVYDSTGTALQDVVVAAKLFEKAEESGQVTEFNLFA